MYRRILLPLLAAAATSACVTARATNFEVPKERASECRNICAGLGMKLGAVVVVMNSAGCVCEPEQAAGASAHGSAAVAAGAAIAVAAQQQHGAPQE